MATKLFETAFQTLGRSGLAPQKAAPDQIHPKKEWLVEKILTVRIAQIDCPALWKLFCSFLLGLICATLPEKSFASSDLGPVFLQAQNSIAPPSGARGLCQKYDWACSKSRKPTDFSKNAFKIVNSVNKKVNARTRSVSDQAQYKKVEVWALPTTRGGDCEDFALLKKRELIKYGIEPTSLFLATVLDKQRRSHAVLVYRSPQGDLVLDNLTNQIKPWRETQYIFLRMQNPKNLKGWVGGFS
ncbi:transglutaminase-like cysteine peptidase [Shimia gijangensis]|uniref:transglutaminase-like cysteine peptidase n=1 Tax=Shimia gijangensis TaxID=1470563 RepID=UPI0015881129|nr:transglutaminase-like cysteine peptidase [Shimia gijangensis]